MTKIKFGTDGWRAIIGDEFTFDNVRLVSQAIADYVGGGSTIVVGYDTRFLGREFAEAVCAVMAGNNIKTLLSDTHTSTPAVSLAIKQNKLAGGIVVTASHNPPQYSGIKFKADYAGPADPEIIAEIEAALGRTPIKTMPVKEAQEKGLLKKVDLNAPHIQFMRSYLDMGLLKRSDFRVLVDVMHGAGGYLAKEVLKESNCRVDTIHADLNPGFGGIHPEPIAHNLKELMETVKSKKYHIGLATDGDVDRIGAVDEDGKFVPPLKIIALILLHFIEDKKWGGGVVKTISSSFQIDTIAEANGLKLYETPVGFKHICQLMRAEDILIGGEESGGIGFKNYIPERDGTLAGLLLVEMMAHRKKSLKGLLSDMERAYGPFCQERIDTKFPNEKKAPLFEKLKADPPADILGQKIVEIKAYDGVKFICEDKSWLLFRASGTEPILRIYAEANSDKKLKELLKFGKDLAFSV
ncbi:MAG: phosphoglucomutase/phosphomannomutase family protein [Candidatus Omnitrophota bacterium]